MYKVMIVEDEMLVRVGIKNSIDWAKFNMRVVADAPNGQIGWELFEKEKPDLVITDLKMPVMDGMELISRIREKDKETRIIILSCLEEFDAVRKALSFNVSDYILKLTMSQEEMESVLFKVKKELDGQISSNSESKNAEADKSIIKESVLKDYLFYNIYTEEKFGELVRDLNLKITPENLVMLKMEIEHYQILQSKLADDCGKLIRFSLLNVMDEVISHYKKGEVFYDSEKYYVMILSFKDYNNEQNILQEICCIINDIKNVLKKFFDVSVSFGISGTKNGYMSLKAMYRECQAALEQKYFEGSGAIIRSYDPARRAVKDKLIETAKALLNELEGIPDINRREIISKINIFIDNLPSTKADVQKQLMQWIHWPVIMLYLSDEKMADLVTSFGERLLSCETMNEAMELLHEYFNQISSKYKKMKSLSTEVADAINYINSNYDKSISLQAVSEHVSVSPNYLTSLFKKELNLSFIDYITEVRIKKSKELLLDTYMKSYEIAEKVGFSDGSYFSRTFKKITGVRPNEFRRKWVTDWVEDSDYDEP